MTIRDSPPDVQKWLQTLVKFISSGEYILAGGRRYYLCKGVASDPDINNCLPSYDFIPWGQFPLNK